LTYGGEHEIWRLMNHILLSTKNKSSTKGTLITQMPLSIGCIINHPTTGYRNKGGILLQMNIQWHELPLISNYKKEFLILYYSSKTLIDQLVTIQPCWAHSNLEGSLFILIKI
jgi:hypothetical protein